MSQNQMFCPSCGTAVSSGARFCRACGTPIGSAGVTPGGAPQPSLVPSGLPSAVPPVAPPPTSVPGSTRVPGRKGIPTPLFVIGGLALVCVCLVCGLGGVSIIGPLGGPTPRPTQFPSTPVARQSLAPSTSPQTVNWNDRVSITIPGDLLTQPAIVSIGTVDHSPAPLIQSMRALATYSIGLDAQVKETKPITVELAFNPKDIDSDIVVDEALSLAVWNAESGDWMAIPSQVDGRRNVVQAQVKLLSLQPSPTPSARPVGNAKLVIQPQRRDESFWTLIYVARGWRNAPSPHFSVIYKPGQSIKVGTTNELAQDFARRIAGWLEVYYSRYKQQNLPVHVWGRQFVFLGDAAGNPKSPVYKAKWYNLNLPADYAGENDAQLDVAHELFHQVQHGHAWALELMWIQEWWMDATADYAADMIALEARGARMGAQIDFDYLQQPITFLGPDNSHAYATAHFIDYLVREGMDFTDAFYQVTRIGPTVTLLDSYLQRRTRRDLGGYYRDFAGYLMFDSNGPTKLYPINPFKSPPNERPDTLTLAPGAALEYDLKLADGYSARLWGVAVATDALNPRRGLLVEALEKGAGTAVDVYLLLDNRRVPGGVKPAASFSARGDTATVVAGGQDVVYILVSTPGNFPGNARVRISATNIAPTPTPTSTSTVTSTPVASTLGDWVLESIIRDRQLLPDWSDGSYTNHKVLIDDGTFSSSDSWKDRLHSGSRQTVCSWNSPPSYLKVATTLSFKASCQTTDVRNGGGASAGGGGWMYWNLNPPADSLAARTGSSIKFLGDVRAATSGDETSASDSKSGTMVVPSGKKGDVLVIVGSWGGPGGLGWVIYKYGYGSSVTPPNRLDGSSILPPVTTSPTPTNTPSVTPSPTKTRTLTPSPTRTPTEITSAVEEIFRVFSVNSAANGATRPTTFSTTESWLVTSIHTYHWNYGIGATPGTIGLRASNGTIFGPWKATGEPGQGGVPNAFWVVKPNVIIPRDTYTVLDSDPGTWAQNSDTGGAGMGYGFGIRRGRP
ncbi:hypothetical protein ANRL3_00424 [Anaerolineae bacterium]|nr:hypothetical protein ANRL3_00424 [Anaerolineae bacterium]